MLDIVEVAFDPRISGDIGLLTYLNPEGAKPGQLVFAPLAARQALGVVVASNQVTHEELGFDPAKLRAVSAPITGLDLPHHGLTTAGLISAQYASSLGSSLALFMPAGVRERLVTHYHLKRKPTEDDVISTLQTEVIKTIEEQGGVLRVNKSKPLESATKRALNLLKAKGIVGESLGIAPLDERSQLPARLQLGDNPEKIEQFLRSEGRKKPAQAMVLIRLQESSESIFTPSDLKALTGVSDATLRVLLKGQLIKPVESTQNQANAPILNADQQKAVDKISASIEAGKFEKFLLHGITGSGKTEVYLRAATQVLRSGRQVLYLVPEIALTAHAIGSLRSRFGDQVAVLHSRMTPAERLRSWSRIHQGEAPIVLGPRSGLFAPLNNIGLIVIDEEHDSSYKQESSPRYSTHRVAEEIAQTYRCPLVLGSATPSLESFYEARSGKSTLLEMPVRAAAASLPAVQVLDLKSQFRGEKKASILTDELHAAILARLERNEQTILFLNRRAYAPFLSCRDCGNVMNCPNCHVSLSFHKFRARVKCHYCAYQEAAPDLCPQCQSDRLRPSGTGTQKVEEFLKTTYPNARIARLDRDVTQRKDALETILAEMRGGVVDILVGTQMVAKGLDFPNVTLVGVILADTSLHLPDFRAAERTFQLLTQVAGRAGRANKAGEVIVQTFTPENHAIVHAQTHDFHAFYEEDLAEREACGYPPFNRLVNVLLSGENRQAVVKLADQAAKQLREQQPHFFILGPVDCVLDKLQGKYRRHLLVKLLPSDDVQAITEAFADLHEPGVSLIVDVDPQNMI